MAPVSTKHNPVAQKSVPSTTVERHPFATEDYGIIIRAFEIESTNIETEEAAQATHYKDVYSTRSFSERTRKQMDYYPGMHQSANPPKEDPFYTESQDMASDRMKKWDKAFDSPRSFQDGLRQNQKDFDYSKIFDSDASAKERAEQLGKMITECVPCFGRLLDADNLLPDGDLLEIHALNLKIKSDLLDEIKDLFSGKGSMNLDICELLNLLSRQCPADLLAMIALFTQYLAKMNLDIKFNIDFIANLIGPILSPFLDALSQWLDKWVQLIIEPMICVVDHINETIALAQSVKIPFSEAKVNFESEHNAALPNNIGKVPLVGGLIGGKENLSSNLKIGADRGTKETWSKGEVSRFNTPKSVKYNPNIPKYPGEEASLAATEIAAASREAVGKPISKEKREEQDKAWKRLKDKNTKKNEKEKCKKDRKTLSQNRDGSRWSKDDVPNSEKDEASFDNSYHPPEKQDPAPKEAAEYWDPAPIVNSVVQMRNILQGAIQYMKDWFTYLTQMIYDLLGTDAGWMKKKTDTTKKKTEILQLIVLIKSIIEAIRKNGLECGKHTNFDPDQARFILEDTLNQTSPTQFSVKENGDIEVILPGKQPLPDTQDSSKTETDGIDAGPDLGIIDDKAKVKQKSVESGIIVKNCLKDVTTEELSRAQEWIAEFERGISNA